MIVPLDLWLLGVPLHLCKAPSMFQKMIMPLHNC